MQLVHSATLRAFAPANIVAAAALLGGVAFMTPAAAAVAASPASAGIATSGSAASGLAEGLVQEAQYHRRYDRHHYRPWRRHRACHYEWRRRWVGGHWRSYRIRVCRF